MSENDRIERQILLRAPRLRVWQALTDIAQFNRWFGVALRGTTFRAGERFAGKVTYPGYEHLDFEIWIERCEPPSLLSWRWHPAAIEAAVDYSREPTTLVEFRLSEAGEGTLLRLTESGLAQIPAARRAEAFRLNSSGWDEQLSNIDRHVAAAS